MTEYYNTIRDYALGSMVFMLLQYAYREGEDFDTFIDNELQEFLNLFNDWIENEPQTQEFIHSLVKEELENGYYLTYGKEAFIEGYQCAFGDQNLEEDWLYKTITEILDTIPDQKEKK